MIDKTKYVLELTEREAQLVWDLCIDAAMAADNYSDREVDGFAIARALEEGAGLKPEANL